MPEQPSTTGSSAHEQLLVITVLVCVLVGSIASVALLARPGQEDVDSSTRERVDFDGVTLPPAVSELHAVGVTGENVTVGVIGATGFDTDRPVFAENIAGTRSFAATGTIRNGGDNDHGTAAASLVTQMAPDAELYLTRVDSGQGFRAAVAWLLQRDVDVIVAPVAFYGKPGDGSSQVARAAAAAVDRGVVVVTPAGNLGQSHWSGSFDPRATTGAGDIGVHRFGNGTTLELDGDGRELRVWLSWDEQGQTTTATSQSAFSVYIYRVDGNETRLVARSKPFTADASPNERIVTTVDPAGTYVLRLRGPTAAEGVTVEIESPTHQFDPLNRSNSLVAPATGDEVLAVGAYDPRDESVEPFSSVGVTTGADGPRVDIVAPDRLRTTAVPTEFVGSSAASAYVAGVVALLLDVAPELTPDSLGRVLKTTARPVDSGPAAGDGAGVVDPEAAVGRIRNTTARWNASRNRVQSTTILL